MSNIWTSDDKPIKWVPPNISALWESILFIVKRVQGSGGTPVHSGFDHISVDHNTLNHKFQAWGAAHVKYLIKVQGFAEHGIIFKTYLISKQVP